MTFQLGNTSTLFRIRLKIHRFGQLMFLYVHLNSVKIAVYYIGGTYRNSSLQIGYDFETFLFLFLPVFFFLTNITDNKTNSI